MDGAREPFDPSLLRSGHGKFTVEILRLVALCRALGVGTVVAEIGNFPNLLAAVANECRCAGLIDEAQYLDYYANPYD
jgi:hypothetical protein